jgi:nicotinamidase-related amidase
MQQDDEARPRLHAWKIPDREIERMMARRDRRHADESLTAVRTALVIIDMVRFYVTDDPYGLGIVAQIQALAAGCGGRAGRWRGSCLWSRSPQAPRGQSSTGRRPSNCCAPPGERARWRIGCGRSWWWRTATWWWRRAPGGQRYRHGPALGYRVVLVADGAATYSDQAHNATLTTVYRSFGDVRAAADVLALLR